MLISNRDSVEFDGTPYDEQCESVGPNYNAVNAKRECNVFIRQLERMFPIPVDVDAYYKLKRNEHDFGTYYDVAINYDSDCEKSTNYAFHVESNLPQYWDSAAIAELVSYNIPYREMSRN